VIIEPDILRVSELIEKNLGLSFPENRLQDLKKIILSALTDLGFDKSFDNFCKAIFNDSFSPMQYEILALHLTVGETYFFRENLSLEALKNNILPPLIEERPKGKREIRMWSAGCCSGEEAYTLAILLYEMLPDIESWNITIIGTDINRKFIQKAIKGRYTQWSFRTTPINLLNRYFKKTGNEFEVIPEIKKMVSFSFINLADNKYPSIATNTEAIDVIFCRNVLMYFSVEQRANVINRFTQSLVHNGWLITSPVEVFNEDIPNLTRVNIDGAIVYQKGVCKSEKSSIVFHSGNRQEQSERVENIQDHLFGHFENKTIHKVKHNLSVANQKVKPAIKSPANLMSEEVKKGPTDLQKAEKSYKQRHYKDALILYKTLHIQNPNDHKIIYFIAKSAANLGYHSEARLWCEELIVKETMNANYYYLLATILIELNEITQAEQFLKKVTYLDHQHILAQFVMANWNQKTGKRKEAQKHYQNITNLLASLEDDWVIPESDGITVSRMKEMIAMFR
jgi:chemotaxis protein methyltransferase CheR